MQTERDNFIRRSKPLYGAAAFVILALGLGTLLVLAKSLLVPIALAVLLSFALSPIVTVFQRIKAPRALAIAAALGLAMASVAVSLWLLTEQVAEVGARLPSYQSTIEEKVHAIADRFSGSGQLSRLFEMIEGVLHEVAPAAGAKSGADPAQRVVVVEDSPFAQIGTLGGYASPFMSTIVDASLVLLLTGFMLAQREDLRNRLISLIGADDIKRTTEAIDDAGRRVGRIMFAQVALNTVYGVGVGMGLWLIGVPNPILWGALAGVARFVPYFGVAVGLLPILLVAFAFDPSWKPFLETFALFAIVEPITGQIVEPLLYGRSSGLSPVAVVVSTAVWAYIWGPIGLVLATPLTVCMVVIGRHAPGLGFIETVLGDEPPLEPHEMFYQRMLAGDPRDAFLQAKQFLTNQTMTAYYDEIALDAVKRAHVDVVRGEFEPSRLETLVVAMRQLVDWLGEVQGDASHAAPPKTDAIALRTRGRNRPDEAERRLDRSDLPDLWRGETPVAVLHDDQPLDAIAASMLAQALKRQGLNSRVATLTEARETPEASAAEVALVFLCFVEPWSLPELRILSSAVHKRCPQANVVLCVWRDDDEKEIKGHAKQLRVDFIATRISSALSAALRLATAKRFANARQRYGSSPRLARSIPSFARKLPEVS